MRTEQAFDPWQHQGSGSAAAAFDPLQMAQRALRGRYLLTAAVGVALAVVGAAIGYLATKPRYTSVGVVNIAPVLPHRLEQNDLTGPMPAFESYVDAQAQLIRGERVRTMAFESQVLRDAQWPQGTQGLVELERALVVNAPKRAQNITVSATHTDPVLARAAVDAVLTSYQRIAQEQGDREFVEVEQPLIQRRDQLVATRDRNREEARARAQAAGTDNLERTQQTTHDQVARLDAMIFEIERRLSAMGIDPNQSETGAAPEPALRRPADAHQDVSPERLAAFDAELRRLLELERRQRAALEAQSEYLGPQHREIRRMRAELDATGSLIRDRVEVLLVEGLANVSETAVLADGPASLQAELRQARRQRQQLSEELTSLGRTQLQIQLLTRNADLAEEELRRVESRLEQIRLERQDREIGRISVQQFGSRPLQPSSDRRTPLAAAGALGGMAAGVGLVGLFGLTTARSYLDVRTEHREPVVGVVPSLSEANGALTGEDARHIHILRGTLEARMHGESERRIHLVTSSDSGEGKSTLAKQLAGSLAGSGRRTLLVDADLVHRSITREVGLEDAPGLGHMVAAHPDAAHPTLGRRDGYDVLGAGAKGSGPEAFSARILEHIVARWRRDYDAVVIDTGPILGSLEAMALAPVTDDVVFVVARGRPNRQVKLSLERLRELGASRVGVVFNRATEADVRRSSSAVSGSVRSRRPDDPGRGASPAA